jgi:hypothetical protein
VLALTFSSLLLILYLGLTLQELGILRSSRRAENRALPEPATTPGRRASDESMPVIVTSPTNDLFANGMSPDTSPGEPSAPPRSDSMTAQPSERRHRRGARRPNRRQCVLARPLRSLAQCETFKAGGWMMLIPCCLG